MTDDGINWELYQPWYETVNIKSSQIQQVAESINWEQFSHPPNTAPRIKDEYHARDPRLGDFIRTAVIRRLADVDGVVDINTGPGWTTEKVSVLIQPTKFRQPGPNATVLTPELVLQKLRKYGFLPVDGYFVQPDVCYTTDEEIVPRRIIFLRGQALEQWIAETTIRSPLFDDEEVLEERGVLRDHEWSKIIPSVKTRILTYEDLFYLTRSQPRKST